MTIDRVFVAFMVICGLAAALVVVAWPESRIFMVGPYFWVLIAMVLFEGLNFARTRGAPGTVISIEARLIGFAVGIGLLIVIPIIAGSSGRLF
jgi:hypothetical protein